MLLVVDDEEPALTVTARMLKAGGYRVVTASDGFEALRVLESTTAPVRLVITDLKMPGMDGEQLAERLLDRTPTPRVLFISGFLSPRSKGQLPGPLLSKPFSEGELLRAVDRLLKVG